MFQDFRLSITTLGNDEYLIRTERTAPGIPVTEEKVTWTVDDWINSAKNLMNDPLSLLLQGNGRFENNQLITHSSPNITTSSLSLANFGQTLYHALFTGRLQESWLNAQSIARNQDSILRLRLGFKDKRLARIPWELLHTPDSHPIAVGTEILFSRYHLHTELNNPKLLTPLSTHEPLKILMVIASPDDKESLQLTEEAHHLQNELQRESPLNVATIQLQLLEQPGREELTQALEQGQYQVFHYAGHSSMSSAGGDIYLVNRQTGLTETLHGEDLAGLLVNNGIQFAVFNSCHGADNPLDEEESNGERTLAQSLVKRGIPAVLAMSAKIPDQVALTLTRLLYRNINQGYPVDLSLNRARQGLISAYGSNQLYWALPVLYLHTDFNGILVHPEEIESSSQWWMTMDDEELDRENNLFIPHSQKRVSSQSIPGSYSLQGEQSFVTGLLEEIKSETTPVTAPKSPALITPSVEKKQGLGLIVGSVVLLTVIGSGFWVYQSQFSHRFLGQVKQVTPSTSVVNSNSLTPDELKSLDTSVLTSVALDYVSQGNLKSAKLSIELLLDRNALPQTQAIMGNLSSKQLEDAEINFLLGRLAWQSVRSNNSNYNLYDARRYWETAVKADPKSIDYLTALGFSYYLEKNYDLASQTFYSALKLAKNQEKEETKLLNIYAGLSLSLKQQANSYQGSNKTLYLEQSINLKQQTMNLDPINFQANKLSQNWLWTEAMIQEWTNP